MKSNCFMSLVLTRYMYFQLSMKQIQVVALENKLAELKTT